MAVTVTTDTLGLGEAEELVALAVGERVGLADALVEADEELDELEPRAACELLPESVDAPNGLPQEESRSAAPAQKTSGFTGNLDMKNSFRIGACCYS